MKLYVKEIETDEVVREIDVTGHTEQHCDKVLRGLLRQMNHEDYYVDDSEVDEHFAAERSDA